MAMTGGRIRRASKYLFLLTNRAHPVVAVRDPAAIYSNRHFGKNCGINATEISFVSGLPEALLYDSKSSWRVDENSSEVGRGAWRRGSNRTPGSGKTGRRNDLPNLE